MFKVSRALLLAIMEAAGAVGFSFAVRQEEYELNNDELNGLIATMQKAPFGVVTNLISQVEKCETEQDESVKEDADKIEIE